MVLFLSLLGIFAGAMLPLQAAINARLATAAGSPIWAAAISGAVLTLVLIAAALTGLRTGPRLAGNELPWWAWTGGFCGAVVLSATTAIVPRLGASTMIALVMAGQILSSILLDQFGLLGLSVHETSTKRMAASILLMAGAALMR
ncbi:DMT family transporter [Paraburkholderia sp. GAS42]|uniref:DMT family transporter n=1 Tax=Paraburkholderia sp. GAS42 TaxID=3035135 RepID=UPI003D25061F